MQPLRILLVEDNPGDARLTTEALRECGFVYEVRHVADGEAALAYLRCEGAYIGAERPDVILLDLNLPRRDGRSVLAVVKSDDDLKRIPVIVLTTSGSDDDVASSYNLHANAYIRKPIAFDDFTAAVRTLGSFWLSTVRLPAR